jgi:hypothetical protein
MQVVFGYKLRTKIKSLIISVLVLVLNYARKEIYFFLQRSGLPFKFRDQREAFPAGRKSQ